MVRPWSPIWVVAAMATSSTRSGRQLRVAAQQLADAADHEVVGAGVGVHAAGLAERGADAVDEDDVAGCSGHRLASLARDLPSCYSWVTYVPATRCVAPVTPRGRLG